MEWIPIADMKFTSRIFRIFDEIPYVMNEIIHIPYYYMKQFFMMFC